MAYNFYPPLGMAEKPKGRAISAATILTVRTKGDDCAYLRIVSSTRAMF